jgi:hypothetical protein
MRRRKRENGEDDDERVANRKKETDLDKEVFGEEKATKTLAEDGN